MEVPTIYADHQSTLKKTSKDDVHEVFMVDDEVIPVYDYDGVVKDYFAKRSINRQKSNDALYVDAESIVFIEFKNGKSPSIPGLQAKAYDSLLVLFDQGMGLQWIRADFQGNISYSRKHIDYILVWEDRSSPREKINNHVKRLAKFRLDHLQKYLYREMHVYNKAEFEVYFIQKYKHLYKNQSVTKE